MIDLSKLVVPGDPGTTPTVIILDVTGICYRALHAANADVDAIDEEDFQSFILERFFRQIMNLTCMFDTTSYVFAFDDPYRSIRRESYTIYKAPRKLREKSPREIAATKAASAIIHGMCDEWLAYIGFSNVFKQEGLEADDIMAMVANTIPNKTIMVTDDADLYQCISSRVSQYRLRHGRTYRYNDFVGEYRIEPKQWADVKAIGGCHSDHVLGVPGCGEKGALQYLRGELNPKGKKWIYLNSEEGRKAYRDALPLVRLPHESTQPISLSPDAVDVARLRRLFSKFGLTDLATDPEWDRFNV